MALAVQSGFEGSQAGLLLSVKMEVLQFCHCSFVFFVTTWVSRSDVQREKRWKGVDWIIVGVFSCRTLVEGWKVVCGMWS